MQFRAISFRLSSAAAPAEPAAAAEPKPAFAPAIKVEPVVAPATKRQALLEGAQNLLKHIPGEASGFYLMAVDSIDKPGLGTLGLIFFLSLILLVVVRWAAGASRWIMLTTIGAFLLWMFVLDNGILHAAFPDLLPDPLGLIFAVFYSTLITILASAGKIQ